MSDVGLRPSFSDFLPLPPEETRTLLIGRIQDQCADCECKSFSGYVALRIPPEQRRFYSPRLILSLDSDDGQGTRITGTFGPNANMWSAFLYSYLAAGSVALFSGILGFCQWKIGITSWGLWIFVPALMVLIGLYAAGRIGRTLGAGQTERLRSIYESAMGHRISLE